MDKISSKYIIKNILSYCSLNIFLKIIKINKKLQNFLDISLNTYQKIFLLNKLQINYDEINIDKLIIFLNKEFKNFNNTKDKTILEEIIQKIKKEKISIPATNIPVSSYQQMKITLNNEIKWYKNENIIKLDFKELYSISEKYIRIPPGIFPNLKVLYINNKFIVPSSMIINLSELIIDYYFDHKILFINDINKEEIDLNNLLYLTIKSYHKGKNINYNNNDIISNFNFNYKIKFHLTKLKQLTINTISNDDNSFLVNYFDLDILYNATLDKKVENLPKLKIKYFQFESIMNSLNYLSIKNNIIINIEKTIFINFEMKTFQNGLKNYRFNIEHFNFNLCKNRIHSLEEKYEENKNKKKMLTFYKYYNYFKEINISMNDNLNVIKIGNYGYLNSDKINNIFNIKKNNYSVQQIYLNFKNKSEKYYYNLCTNISKFKVLNKLYLFDCIPKCKIMSFIESISKLKLLEQIYIISYEKLSNKEIKSIQKILPQASIKVDIGNNKTFIIQNYVKDNGDDIFFL